MSRDRCEKNLVRLLQDLDDYLGANGIDRSGVNPVSAKAVAQNIFLAHSTSVSNFVKICDNSGRLLSPQALDLKGIKPLQADAVENTLGTAGFVFLYAAPFSFPSSGCGLLFAKSLEHQHSSDGFATPFDSGALVNHFVRPEMAETPRDFFLRHELPISEHRNYLERCVGSLFVALSDYQEGNRPLHPGPIGLTGGDRRQWTHEVRIPDEVVVRSQHLQAIFAPRRLGLVPEIKNLLNWCSSEGYDVEIFDADRENDFAKLRDACIEYLRTELI